MGVGHQERSTPVQLLGVGWTDNPSDHFEFTFLRLMEGGVSVPITLTVSYPTTGLSSKIFSWRSSATKSTRTTRHCEVLVFCPMTTTRTGLGRLSLRTRVRVGRLRWST